MADKRIVPISNLPHPDTEEEIPKSLRVYQLRREVAFLRGELVRVKEQVRFKDQVLKEQIDYFHLGLDDGEWTTLGHVLLMVKRLESSYSYQGPAYAGGYEDLFQRVGDKWKRK